ncbi:GGDEF domain-containing protein [Roseibium sediminis]|uniref:GGDEF domain-containing protein n=1 Tax=Roseibium sediminis TaxID=1775174 RepID=UPI0013756303|nr:GGDEF domain-containing protein [Roseibium sediminis]
MPLTNPFAHEKQFDDRLATYRRSADHIMVGTNVFLFLICLPFSWYSGEWLPTFLIGLPTLLLSIFLAHGANGQLVTRLFMGCAFMTFTGLYIHLSGGDIEAHFSAFGLIGILLYYRDWRVIVAATVFIYFHHLIVGLSQTFGMPVFVFDNPLFWTTFLLHVAYFLPFVGMMGYLAIAFRREGYQNQLVIEMANKVAQGDLRPKVAPEVNYLTNHGLLGAVTTMHSRILQLLSVIPAPVIVVRKTDHVVVNVNSAWANDFNIDPNPDAIIDRPLSELMSPGNYNKVSEFLNKDASQAFPVTLEFDWRQSEERERRVELRKIAYKTELADLEIVVGNDVTEQFNAENQLREIAYTDVLTNAANRASLHIKLDEARSRLKEDYKPFAVLLFDLDGFKEVNDDHGHDAGDLVLKTVVKRMMSTLERRAFVARLGGDEFVVLLDDTDSSEHCQKYAEYLIRQIEIPVTLQSRENVSVSASAGIKICAAFESELTSEDVLKSADIALYGAKAAGKGRAILHHDEMGQPRTLRLVFPAS